MDWPRRSRIYLFVALGVAAVQILLLLFLLLAPGPDLGDIPGRQPTQVTGSNPELPAR